MSSLLSPTENNNNSPQEPMAVSTNLWMYLAKHVDNPAGCVKMFCQEQADRQVKSNRVNDVTHRTFKGFQSYYHYSKKFIYSQPQLL